MMNNRKQKIAELFESPRFKNILMSEIKKKKVRNVNSQTLGAFLKEFFNVDNIMKDYIVIDNEGSPDLKREVEEKIMSFCENESTYMIKTKVNYDNKIVVRIH